MGWEDQEMAASNIGDERLNKRGTNIVGRLFESIGCSLTESLKGRAELVAAYRFFDNDRTTPQKILSSHIENTKSRIKEHEVILCPNDTTSIDFTSKSTIKGLGILETPFTRGLFMHPTLAITPDQVCLGCIDVKMWSRDRNAKRRSLSSGVRNNQPIEEKESFRWVESFRVVNELAKEIPETQFINIGDRESDILEYVVEAVEAMESEKHAYAIVRINHDRSLISDKEQAKKTNCKKATIEDLATELGSEEEQKLKKKILQAPTKAEVTFMMPTRNSKPERQVTQKIRATKVILKGKKVGDRIYPSVEINAVCAIEEAPPTGETPICWMFFTTLPINTAEEVHNVIKFYLCRWGIEIFFHVFKTGCKVEEKELKTADRIKNMLALFLIVSWRVVYITAISRQRPNISCTEIFEEAEWKSLYKLTNKSASIPSEPLLLGELVLLIAKLGGYLPRKDSSPGPKVIWRGLKRMYDFALAWENFVKGDIE